MCLNGCATIDSDVPMATAYCPPLVMYTPAEQQAAQQALTELLPDNILWLFMTDYAQLRDAVRDCHNIEGG
jgi:hypothetical protein